MRAIQHESADANAAVLRRPPSRLAMALVALAFLGLTPALRGATLHVPAEYASIQAALNAAGSGDTVLVAAGTYFEHGLSFNGKNLSLMSAAGPATTIINGQGLGRVFELTGGLSRAALVQGFTITNGMSASGGGGILISGASPTIRGNRIQGNTSGQTGGGIKATSGSNPLIDQNVISNNEAAVGGGGIHVENSTAEINGNTITDNVATDTNPMVAITGGGIKVTFTIATVVIRDNFIRRNSVFNGGGGIACFDGDIDVLTNEITDNVAGDLGGGVLFEADDGLGPRTGRMIGNVISRNTAPVIGGGVHTFLENTSSTIEITDNVLEGNESLNPADCTSAAGACGKGGALGLYRGNGVAQQVVRGNTLRANRADQYGAVILLASGLGNDATFTFEDNTVEANTSRFGYPALTCVGTGECHVARNRFIDNMNDAGAVSATRNPGALYLKNSGVTNVDNNYLRGNVGYHAGAILLIDTDPNVADPQVRNNTFVDNATSVAFGGTMWIEVPSLVANNVFQGDLRGVRTSAGAAVEARNNDFFGQTGSDLYRRENTTYSSVASLNAESFASGNVAVDPDFALTGDLYLNPGSALVNAGRCDLAPSDDFDGESRPMGGGCEIGADEYSPNGGLIFADGFESGDTSAW